MSSVSCGLISYFIIFWWLGGFGVGDRKLMVCLMYSQLFLSFVGVEGNIQDSALSGQPVFYWWRNKHIFHFWGFTVTDLNCTVRPNNICKSITFSRWHFLINKDLLGKTFISLNDRPTHNLYMAIGLLYCLLLLIVSSHSITWSYDHMFICLSSFIDTTDTLLNTGSWPNGSKFKVT